MNWFRKIRALGVIPQEGFVYVPSEGDSPMTLAREGQVARIEGRGPPWIVVNHHLDSVILAKWPGSLWRVRIVEPATARDQSKVGGPPLPYARYTRAIAVLALGEISANTLFGPHGDDVAAILAKASLLDHSLAERLASHRHPDAPQAYERAWRAWMKEHSIADEGYHELDGTLKLGGVTSGSPVNEGLSVLHRVVFDRARSLDGEAAIRQDDDDVWLEPPWSGADRALGDAALALGAPELISEADRVILLQAWRVCGLG